MFLFVGSFLILLSLFFIYVIYLSFNDIDNARKKYNLLTKKENNVTSKPKLIGYSLGYFLLFLFLGICSISMNEPGLDINKPETLIGTYTGSKTIDGVKIDMTLIIEDNNRCKVKYWEYATKWDRFTLKYNKDENLIYFGNNMKLELGNDGFDVYQKVVGDWVYLMVLYKQN